jgi:hypothetical protein
LKGLRALHFLLFVQNGDHLAADNGARADCASPMAEL